MRLPAYWHRHVNYHYYNLRFLIALQGHHQHLRCKATVPRMARPYHVTKPMIEDEFSLFRQQCWKDGRNIVPLSHSRNELHGRNYREKNKTAAHASGKTLTNTETELPRWKRIFNQVYGIRNEHELEIEKKPYYRIYTDHSQCAALQTAKRPWRNEKKLLKSKTESRRGHKATRT